MLVLTRKKNESVYVRVGGQLMKVTVVENGPRTRLGFTGSTDIVVQREELFLQDANNRKEAEQLNLLEVPRA